jgi:hypothetical protein
MMENWFNIRNSLCLNLTVCWARGSMFSLLSDFESLDYAAKWAVHSPH